MSKYFRPWNIDQTLLLPPNVQDFVPKGHVSRFIVGLVRESLDLKEITGGYVSGLGQPPFDPRMMVALLLHGYASGLYSSRRIARACRERNDFVMIVALDPPDFRTISDFRKRHLKALGALFLQVLKLCETAGLVKLGHVALDGTKIKANASKHKAMSYERMKKREAELKAEVARMLAAAEAADAQEDETFGQDKRGDEMPDWAGDKQKRLAKIQQAMAALEADARLAAEEERRIEAEKEKQRQAEGRKKPGKPAAPPSDQPDPKSQRNFTDPESRIMKSKDGFVQAYNAQAAVDAGAQIIVAHELTQCGNDQGQLLPLIEATENNLGRNYQPNTFGESPGESRRSTVARPFADAEQGPKRRLRAESFADHYSQARQFFISQTRGEQAHIVAALTFELSKVKTPAIRERMVLRSLEYRRYLANKVADKLGLQKMPKPADAAVPTRQDLDASPALSIVQNGPERFEGRKLGILVSDGSDAGLLKALKGALDKAGAAYEIIAPKVTGVEANDGGWIEADQMIDGGPSVLYDGVARLPAADAMDDLLQSSSARDFVADAFAHCKFIGYVEAALPLFEKSGVATEDFDEGCIAIGSTKDAKSFVDSLSKLRIWGREPHVKMP